MIAYKEYLQESPRGIPKYDRSIQKALVNLDTAVKNLEVASTQTNDKNDIKEIKKSITDLEDVVFKVINL